MATIVTPEKFYKIFLNEIRKSNIQSIPWNSNKEWTKKLLKGEDCVMNQIANKINLVYCEEYWKLDGIFCEGFMPKNPLTQKDIIKDKWAYGIKIILEIENASSTLWKEIWKLIPLFSAPLKVIITYPKNEEESEKIKNMIKNRVKSDDLFELHKNKIKILLIFGINNNMKIVWQAFVYQNKKFKIIS